MCPLFNTPSIVQKKEIILFGLCSSSTYFPGNLIEHVVALWFNTVAIWKATLVFHFKFPFTVFFSPCQMEWKMERKQKCLKEKRWIFTKVRAFGPTGYCSCFCIQLSVAKSCVYVGEQLCICVCVLVYKWRSMHAQRVFFKRVCISKGCCLYQFTTAPELMWFRAENKAVHFNSLASGAQQPAVHDGARVVELYVCAR